MRGSAVYIYIEREDGWGTCATTRDANALRLRTHTRTHAHTHTHTHTHTHLHTHTHTYTNIYHVLTLLIYTEGMGILPFNAFPLPCLILYSFVFCFYTKLNHYTKLIHYTNPLVLLFIHLLFVSGDGHSPFE
jgi:hypothetical protein